MVGEVARGQIMDKAKSSQIYKKVFALYGNFDKKPCLVGEVKKWTSH